MANELITTSMKNYLSSPNVNKYIDEILGERKGMFMSTLTSMVNNNEKLKGCDKSTVLMAALKSVGLNLSIDPSLGQAYIIAYGVVATFQIGYKGIIQLALRTRQYESINAKEVKEGEYRGYDDMGDPVVIWKSPEERFKLKTIGYFAGFKLTSGFRKTDYWTIAEVEKHANTYSQGYKAFKKYGKSTSTAKSGNMTNPWESDFDGMSKKSVLKNVLSKYGIMSIELQEAIKYDQASITIDDEGNEKLAYPDNDIAIGSGRIDKKQQDLLLKSYTPEIIQEALYVSELQDITQIMDFDGFTLLCINLVKDQAAVTMETPPTPPLVAQTGKEPTKMQQSLPI